MFFQVDPDESKVDEESVVDLSATSDSVIASHSSCREAKASKSEKMLDKISGKASKFLPSKGSIGKFFHGEGNKEEPPPAIYTIDREMGRTNMAFQQEERVATSPTQVAYISPTRGGYSSPIREGYISPTRDGYRSPTREGYRSPTRDGGDIETTLHR